MSFIPGFILGVLITMYREEIILEAKNFYGWIGKKPWKKLYHYHKVRYRIINEDDIKKKTILYFYENNFISSKQYEKLLVTYRSMRKLKLISAQSPPSSQDKSTIHTI